MGAPVIIPSGRPRALDGLVDVRSWVPAILVESYLKPRQRNLAQDLRVSVLDQHAVRPIKVPSCICSDTKGRQCNYYRSCRRISRYRISEGPFELDLPARSSPRIRRYFYRDCFHISRTLPRRSVHQPSGREPPMGSGTIEAQSHQLPWQESQRVRPGYNEVAPTATKPIYVFPQREPPALEESQMRSKHHRTDFPSAS
jgi:hypothetical protein